MRGRGLLFLAIATAPWLSIKAYGNCGLGLRSLKEARGQYIEASTRYYRYCFAIAPSPHSCVGSRQELCPDCHPLKASLPMLAVRTIRRTWIRVLGWYKILPKPHPGAVHLASAEVGLAVRSYSGCDYSPYMLWYGRESVESEENRTRGKLGRNISRISF